MSWYLRAALVLPICLPLCTQAHMQMSSPFPLRSPLDPAVPEQYKDYSMTSPLLPDGSNFPCKHYQYNDTNPQAYDIKATYQAGNNYSLTLEGSATHSGGSCQISLSYDNGVTFKVIESIIGGCPLAYTYPFTIPSFAPPSSSVLLSWSWFNLVGSREMYQNCARVQINGAPTQRYRRTTYDRRQSSLDQLPDMFACNVGNGCMTVENAEVVFPNPGSNVVYGQDAITPRSGPGFVITGSTSTTTSASTTSGFSTTSYAPFPTFNSSFMVGPTGTGYTNYNPTALTISSMPTSSTSRVTTSMSTSSQPTISTSTPSITQQFGPVTVTVTITVTPTPIGTLTPSPTLTTSTTTLMARDTTALTTTLFTTLTLPASTSTLSPSPSSQGTLPCTPGTFYCNTPSTFSQCSGSGTSYIPMGPVAAGMQCVSGQIIRQNAGNCAINGQIVCNGLDRFYICDMGGLINMGSVARGTVCRDGVIVAS